MTGPEITISKVTRFVTEGEERVGADVTFTDPGRMEVTASIVVKADGNTSLQDLDRELLRKAALVLREALMPEDSMLKSLEARRRKYS